MIHHCDPDLFSSLSRLQTFFPGELNENATPFGAGCPSSRVKFLEARFRSNLGSAAGPDYLSTAVRAMGEALERHAFRHTKPDVRAVTFNELKARKLKCLDPSSFRLFATGQSAVKSGEVFNLKTDSRIDWTYFEDLHEGEPVLVPSDFNQFFRKKNPIYCSANTSGNAVGISLENAALGALLELIERDAFMLYWWTRNAPRKIDFEPAFPGLREELFGNRGKINVFCLETDLGIPVAAATFRGEIGRKEPRFIVTAAAHTDLRRAVEKAFFELAQSFWGFNDHFEDLPRFDYGPHFEKSIWAFEDHWLLYGLNPAAEATGFFFSNKSKPLALRETELDASTELKRILSSFKENGVRVFLRDFSSRDLKSAGLFAVRAVSPDLATLDVVHKYRQLGIKRYYELPRKLGWKRQPRDFGGLNVYPHPFP